jgi:NAD(P)-dependent dehydrogenase (short-subunit alcohol dehydrogenase family)
MRIIVIGRGTIGSAVEKAFAGRGDEVIPVSRSGGNPRVDMSDLESLKALFKAVGPFDAVACCAGEVAFVPLERATEEQWADSIASKAMGQINVVRTALPYMADNGSFALVAGVLSDQYIAGGTIASVVNSMVEGFVKAVAVELPRGIRINAISPTVLTESVAYHPFFPGFIPVAVADVAQAYVRAICNPMTGRIIKLH